MDLVGNSCRVQQRMCHAPAAPLLAFLGGSDACCIPEPEPWPMASQNLVVESHAEVC